MGSAPRVERVALVSPYDFVANGGVTEHVRQLARHLRQHNIEVTIIAPSSRSDHDEPSLISLGPVMTVPINGSVARTTLSPVLIEEVAALLARRPFDVIHLHEPLAPMLPISVLYASSSPNVGTFHASGERSFMYAAGRKLLRGLAKRLTVRIAVSEVAAHFVRRYIGGEYTIIPNGVDTEFFRPDRPPIEMWNDGRPNVLFVGRFDEPRKGFPVLFDAWADVQAERPDARLLVVGRGDPEPFRQRAAELHWENVHFVGGVENDLLPRYYRSATVFCAPSTGQESFGIVLVEAMSSGTPVIASDIGGYRQVLHHRHQGLLVPPRQPKALAAALLHLLDDPELQRTMGRAGRLTARQYAWEGVSERVLDVYARALHTGAAQSRLSLPPSATIPTPATEPAAQHTDPVDHSLTPHQTGADYRTIVQEKGGAPMLTKPFEERVRAVTQKIAGRLLGRSGISPNMMTTIGLLLTLTVTATLASGHLAWGGVLVLVTSAFDMLDGALARATDRKSTFGAFFDSTVDRYTEALVLLGLLLYYDHLPTAGYEVVWIYLGIVGSLMVSYTRARAEALGFECKVGLLGRPERIILLAIGLLVGWVSFALAILAIFTNFTAAQRVFHVWREDRKRQPQVAVAKVPRRGWFAPRDQTPS
jgi:phosphatidyl-myo-inositol alpha-mannosyltransferase